MDSALSPAVRGTMDQNMVRELFNSSIMHVCAHASFCLRSVRDLCLADDPGGGGCCCGGRVRAVLPAEEEEEEASGHSAGLFSQISSPPHRETGKTNRTRTVTCRHVYI